MKIKDILTESHIDNLSKEEFQKLLETDYSQAYEQFKRGNILYRGFGSMDVGLKRFQPMRGRESVNTNNFYTLIMNNSPRFSDFPKRSVIVSSNRNVAMSFASDEHSLAIIFPKNGAKLGVCKVRDIWQAKPAELEGYSKEGFYEIGRLIERLYKWLGVNPHNVKTYQDMLDVQNKFEAMKKEDSEQIVEAMSHLEDYLQQYNFPENLTEEIIEKGPQGLYELINTTPFKLVSVSNMQLGKNNEVWFDEEYLAVSVNIAKTMFGD
jgi:hypothetical protein